MVDWDHAKILKLIGIYEIKPELWDPTNANYHMRNKKHDAWVEIASELESDIDVVKGKINSLLSSFQREKVKIKNSLKTGSGTKQVSVSKWFAFPAFTFLMEKDKIKETTDTENDTSDHDVALSESEAKAETNSIPIKESEEVQKTPSASPIPSTSQHSPSGTLRKRKLFLSPKRVQTPKKMLTEQDPRVAYAYDILRKYSEIPKDECTTFGQHIATKIAKFKDQVRSVVIHKINNIIFDAEMGKYNNYINNIEVNEPSMTQSPLYAHLGYASNSNYSHNSYNSQINLTPLRPPSSNYNYNSQGSNDSCGSYRSETNSNSQGSNSNHPVGQSQQDQTSQNNLNPLQTLFKLFDPSNTNE